MARRLRVFTTCAIIGSIIATLSCSRSPSAHFRYHTQEFDRLASAMKAVRAASDIEAVMVPGSQPITIRTTSARFMSVDEARSIVPQVALAQFDELVVLARKLVDEVEILNDGTVICETWNGGVPAARGLALPGAGGQSTLNPANGIEYSKAVPDSGGWYEWGT